VWPGKLNQSLGFVWLAVVVVGLLGSVTVGFARDDETCDLFKILGRKDLPESFWSEYAEVAASGDKAALKALIDKHGLAKVVDVKPVTPAPIAKLSPKQVQMSHRAQKDYDKIPLAEKGIRRNVNDFLEVAEKGWADLVKFARQRSWNLEPINDKEHWSIRLSAGYRLVFAKPKSGSIEVIGIGNEVYRH